MSACAAHADDGLADADPRRRVAAVEAALEDVRAGRFVAVVDAEGSVHEGSLMVAAQFATPAAISFMAREARGLVCLCLTGERCDELRLPPMAPRGEARHGTAFTVSVEAREGVSTGISAHDRARTVAVAIDPASGPRDLVRPGHVFPLRARPGGVLQRAGQTEAAVDLARLAGLTPAGVTCHVLSDDGAAADAAGVAAFCARHGIRLVSVADVIEYRRRREQLVELDATAELPTTFGTFTAMAFRERLSGKHHLALVRGTVAGARDVLVRVHSECLTGDVFHSLRCDCGEQLELAMARVAAEPCGVVLYLCQEGRGIGLLDKLRAYELQDQGLDTVDANLALGYAADEREYGIGSQILAELGLSTIRVLTNNPRKIAGIGGFGLTVVEQVPLPTTPHTHNAKYLATKRTRLGHKLHHRQLRALGRSPGDTGP